MLPWAGSLLSLGQLGYALSPLGPASIPSCPCPVRSGFQIGHPVTPSRDGELCQLESFPCVQSKSGFLKLILIGPTVAPRGQVKDLQSYILVTGFQKFGGSDKMPPFSALLKDKFSQLL